MGRLLIFFKLDATKKTQNADFRKTLDKNYFLKLQSNLYVRGCVTHQMQADHISFLKQHMPENCRIRAIWITDQQWLKSYSFFGKSQIKE